MDFFRSRLSEKFYDAAAGGASHDGIVNQYYPLPPDALLNGAQLDFHLIQPFALAGRNECPADILILYQPDSIGNS